MSTEQTCSGLHPDILEGPPQAEVSPIIARPMGHYATGATEPMVSCWLAFPGCDFEVLIDKEVVIAFRRGAVQVVRSDAFDVWADSVFGKPFWRELSPEEFNVAMRDNMMLALKHVENSANVVADSKHFVNVFADAIEKISALSEDMRNDQTRLPNDELVAALDDLKIQLFSHLMSKDLRR